MKCSMCGYEIDNMDVLSCHKCFMRKDCQIRHCPNCGYTLVNADRILNYISKIRESYIRLKEKIKRLGVKR